MSSASPVIHVNGNHDYYYGGAFPNDLGDLITIGGIRSAIATLWAYLDAVGRMEAARFPDFLNIQGEIVDRWNDLHLAQLTFLEQARADVIVTHHAPFLRSIHEDFDGDALKAFVMNDLDPERFPKTRLWIHGHVHAPFDYIMPDEDHEIRFVCNPLDYPQTRRRGCFGVKIVEF